MRTIHKLVGTLVLVSMSSLATAQAAQTAAERKAADFRALESEMQQESTNMPSSSPPVDTTAPAEDPVPQATTEQQEIARFRAQEHTMQDESTNMPTSSPPVDKAAPPADPVPKATTKAEKAARFTDQERIMQEESTR
jgi:hypothetical protein